MHVIFTLCPAGSFADLLHSWEQQCHQGANHSNDDQEFNQRKATTYVIRTECFLHHHLREAERVCPVSSGFSFGFNACSRLPECRSHDGVLFSRDLSCPETFDVLPGAVPVLKMKPETGMP